MSTYEFERPFRLKIISLLLNNLWCSRYGAELIKPEYFEQEDEEQIVTGIMEYRKTYGHVPVDPEDLIVLAGAPNGQLIYQLYDMAECGDNALATDKAVEFARDQAIKLAILESVDDYQTKDHGAIIPRIKEALKVGDCLSSPGIDPIRDTDKWLYNYWDDKVRTGLYHLDLKLDGGLGVPELGLILAPMNKGKSMTLINIGYGAASLGSGLNVAHFTHEMSVEQVCKRYAARMMFRFPQRNDNLKEYDDELQAAAKKMMPGQIRVIGGAQKMTTDQIEGHLDRLEAEGFHVGLIIDDYADLIVPPTRRSEYRFELKDIYEWMRGLSEQYQCPVWTATQGTRESLSAEIITLKMIAEDINKAATCDTIVALCQTWQEEQADQARLFLAKFRDGSKKNPLISCKFYGDCQAIITTGYVQRKEEQEA